MQSTEDFSVQLQGSKRDQVDGYWENCMIIGHKSFNGKYQYYIDDYSDVTFGLDYTKRETGDGNSVKGLTEALNNPESKNYVSYSGYYDSDLVKTFLTYSKDFEDESNLMFNVYKYKDDKINYSSRTTDGGTGITYHKSFVEGDWIQDGIKSEYRKPFENFAIMAGIDIQRNSVDNLTRASDINKTLGAITGNSNTKEDINAIYLELKNQLSSKLTTTVNMRYDNIKYDYNNYLDTSLNVLPSYNHSSYRAGLNYNLSNNNLVYTSISTGFRVPTTGQISKNKDGIAQGYDVPESLKPETTTNYEIGTKVKQNSFTYEAAIFQLDRKDYIGRQGGSYVSSSGWGATSNVDEDEYYFNLGDIRSRGFELSLQSDRKKEIFYNLAYTYLNAEFTSYTMTQLVTANTAGWGLPSNATYATLDLSGNSVPRTSAHTLNLTIDYKPNSSLTISPEIIAKSSYYANEINTFKQDGYEVINLRGTYKINKNLELFAKIDNLMNKNYYTFVTVYSSDASNDLEDATYRVAAPRAYYAGLRYKF